MTVTHLADVNTIPDTHGGIPFGRLFDATPTLIAVFEGRDHVYSYTNPAHNNAFGDRPLIGHKLSEAVPELGETGFLDHLNAVLEQGTAVEIPAVEVNLQQQNGHGNRFFYRCSLQPWHDPHGTIAGVMCFAFDVTEDVEARLRAEASEEHLSFALELSNAVGVFEWDMKNDVFSVDQRFLRGFGLDPSRVTEALSLHDFLTNIHDDDRARVVDAINQAVTSGDDYQERYRVRSPSGDYRHVLAKGRCSHDQMGKPDHFAGVVVDITKQYQNEQAVRESETQLRTVFSSIDLGYCVAEMILDQAGNPVDYRFIDVNPQFEDMTGLKDAIGRSALELVPDLERKWVDIYARVALDGETIRFEEGSKAMGRWFNVFAMPLQPRGRFALVFRDITIKKSMKEALVKSEALFRTITEAMPQIVWATRPDGHHDFYNARWYEFTGVPLGSTDGDGWNNLFHADDKDAAWERWGHCLTTGEPYEVEYRLRHHSGDYRWTLGRAQPVRNGEGEIVRWLGTCTDIHDIKIASEQRQLMLDEMNHRVKNTLAIVTVMVSQTLRKADNLQEASAAIQARIHMLSKAHDQLIHAKWAQTYMLEVVETALAPHRTGERRISLEGPDLPLGSKQAMAITLALHELATNAAKYGSLSVDVGTITINWTVEQRDGDDIFRFIWQEAGGPPVVAPTRRGFGSSMIEQALSGYFNGNAELFYNADGLSFELTAPLSGLTA